MVLLLGEDFADGLGDGVFVERFGLFDSAAVVFYGLDFVLKIEVEHILGVFRGLNELGGDGRHTAEVIDRISDLEGVLELFLGVDREFIGDVHVGRALENLGVVDVGYDGLVFAGEIFV